MKKDYLQWRLVKTKGEIMNGYYRNTDNIGHKTKRRTERRQTKQQTKHTKNTTQSKTMNMSGTDKKTTKTIKVKRNKKLKTKTSKKTKNKIQAKTEKTMVNHRHLFLSTRTANSSLFLSKEERGRAPHW